MRREQRRRPWWAVLISGLCGVLLAGSVVGVATHPVPAVKAAAAQRPAVVAAPPSVTFIGDSWTFGEGAKSPAMGYAYLTARQLGWKYTVLGVRGSGYTRGGGAGITFGMRVAQAAATKATVIVVQGSLNERNGSPRALTAGALDTLTRLHAAAPKSQILVVGASYVPSTPTATINWINAAISGAAAKVGLRFVNPAKENWTDPRTPKIWWDPNHPNTIGHQMVANHMKWLLLGMIKH